MAKPAPRPTVSAYGLRVLFRKVYRLIVQPRVVRQDRLVVVDDADRCENPIFVIGCHRSGTTLFRQIIDSHPHIACPAESFFIEFLAHATQHKDYFGGLGYLGFDEPEARKALAKYVGSHFEAYRKSKGKARWADKCPTYTACLPFIDSLFAPGVQYVLIYRHPFDIVNSLISKGWQLYEGEPDPFLNPCRYVNQALQSILAFQAEHPDRCFELRYEKLMAEPEATLREVFSFLGEPWDERVLNFNDQKHDLGVGDAEAMVLKGFRPSQQNWKHWSEEDRARAAEVLADPLERLGYASRFDTA